MFNGELYRNINKVQRLVSKQIINDFSHMFQIRPDGRDSLLDVGCGTGDITADYILPVLPKQFSRLVGGDISESMLSVARKTVTNSKVSFEILDIERPIDNHIFSTPFDHITSFFCLHFVKDQRQGFLNIYNLMKTGGDCLLAYVFSHPVYTVLNQLSKYPRWDPYLKDIDSWIPPFQFSNDPIAPLERIMNDIGFSECNVHVRDVSGSYDGIDSLKAFVRGIFPFLDRLTSKQQHDFLDDFSTEMRGLRLDADASGKILTPFKMIVIFARK